jgi:hypothetical protein
MADTALAPDEILVGRPFTHPELTRREADIMRALLKRERQYVQSWRGESRSEQIVREHDDEAHRHLLVVPDAQALVEASGLTAIGFFGRPRDDVDHTVLFELEDELVERMRGAGSIGLLSYYDVEFVKGAYGNLVPFSTPDGPKEWSVDTVHRRAVDVSLGHYHEVRLHRGSIPGRLLDGGELAITSTRYLDFAGPTIWQGVRRWPAA